MLFKKVSATSTTHVNICVCVYTLSPMVFFFQTSLNPFLLISCSNCSIGRYLTLLLYVFYCRLYCRVIRVKGIVLVFYWLIIIIHTNTYTHEGWRYGKCPGIGRLCLIHAVVGSNLCKNNSNKHLIANLKLPLMAFQCSLKLMPNWL